MDSVLGDGPALASSTQSKPAASDRTADDGAAPVPPGDLVRTYHMVMALVDFVSSFSAIITIALACVQAWTYFEQVQDRW